MILKRLKIAYVNYYTNPDFLFSSVVEANDAISKFFANDIDFYFFSLPIANTLKNMLK